LERDDSSRNNGGIVVDVAIAVEIGAGALNAAQMSRNALRFAMRICPVTIGIEVLLLSVRPARGILIVRQVAPPEFARSDRYCVYRLSEALIAVCISEQRPAAPSAVRGLYLTNCFGNVMFAWEQGRRPFVISVCTDEVVGRNPVHRHACASLSEEIAIDRIVAFSGIEVT